MVAFHQRGFSLVETLVAAMILFSVLTSSFLAFQGSIVASAKAQTRIELLAVVPRIRSYVTYALRNEAQLAGEGVVGKATYSWSAEPKAEGLAFDVDGLGGGSNGFKERRLFLWDVLVRIELEGSAREFIFTELTWDS